MNVNKANSINRLIKKFRAGDNSALEELMLLTYKDLYLISYGYLKDKMLSEDVVSETFIKLIEKADTIKNDKNLNGYLHAMVINKSLDVIRKRKKELYLEDYNLDHLSESQNHEQINVKTTLSLLNSSEREVLLLWHYEYTLNEISDKTDLTINKVRLLLKKAKENFSLKYDKITIG